MNHTTMRRDGGWCIELINPIDKVDKLEIHPPTLDHTIRWGQQRIPSVLAFLAELSGVPEPMLRRLSGPDSDRVLTAFSLLAPPLIQEDFKNGQRPLATPDEAKTPEQRYDEEMLDNDPNDPRFPRVEGMAVKRFKEADKPAAAAEGKPGGLDIAGPDPMRRVG